ncbi:MAG: 30S ribosomal protein S19 [Candidatus Lokiarchaeota archaeon]|nr:30S ribosomal protein S19 [Candidatus Lokiarchaeota archaeon]
MSTDEFERKKFTYRGKTLKELQKMSMDEFIQLVPARMRRSLKRGLPKRHKKVIEKLRKAHRAARAGKELIVRTHCRDLPIFPEFIGLTIGVYNGKDFIPVKVTPEHIGHYLGQFAPTTPKPVTHGSPGIGATKSSQYVPLK